MIIGPSDLRIPVKARYSKADMRILVGLLTVHCTLKDKLHQMKKSDDRLCSYCGKERERSEHLLMKCKAPILLANRMKHLGSYFFLDKDIRDVPLDKLLRFARDTGIAKKLCYRPIIDVSQE